MKRTTKCMILGLLSLSLAACGQGTPKMSATASTVSKSLTLPSLASKNGPKSKTTDAALTQPESTENAVTSTDSATGLMQTSATKDTSVSNRATHAAVIPFAYAKTPTSNLTNTNTAKALASTRPSVKPEAASNTSNLPKLATVPPKPVMAANTVLPSVRANTTIATVGESAATAQIIKASASTSVSAIQFTPTRLARSNATNPYLPPYEDQPQKVLPANVSSQPADTAVTSTPAKVAEPSTTATTTSTTSNTTSAAETPAKTATTVTTSTVKTQTVPPAAAGVTSVVEAPAKTATTVTTSTVKTQTVAPAAKSQLPPAPANTNTMPSTTMPAATPPALTDAPKTNTAEPNTIKSEVAPVTQVSTTTSTTTSTSKPTPTVQKTVPLPAPAQPAQPVPGALNQPSSESPSVLPASGTLTRPGYGGPSAQSTSNPLNRSVYVSPYGRGTQSNQAAPSSQQQRNASPQSFDEVPVPVLN